jgi:putative cardiolipin synthase
MNAVTRIASCALFALSLACGTTFTGELMEGSLRPNQDFCSKIHRLDANLSQVLGPFEEKMATHTGVYVLEDGAGALMSRAWMSEAAEKTIDIQYFIFSVDNVGVIATDYLLRAAQRGVKVRMIVDDLLHDGDADFLQVLDTHKNVEIRIYNPNINIGKSIVTKLETLATDFRGINQRMHNKTFIVDGKTVITGGRNIADEYFDFNQDYSFRDRDVLLLGGVAKDVQASFDVFWKHGLAVPLNKVLYRELDWSAEDVWEKLHQYACDPENFWPQIRQRIERVPQAFAHIAQSGQLQWVEKIRYVSDVPGKNSSKGMSGGGLTTDTLVALVNDAKESVVIQTPYLVTTKLGQQLFANAVKRGVTVKIITNSLASTDNLAAFSGYARDRHKLLDAGVQIYEFRPDAAVRRRIMTSSMVQESQEFPVFGIHAKTMVVDGKLLVVGTFNLDPRSANLNTECITIMESEPLAQSVLGHLNEEMKPENSWHTTKDFNPDDEAGCWKVWQMKMHRPVPKSIL